MARSREMSAKQPVNEKVQSNKDGNQQFMNKKEIQKMKKHVQLDKNVNTNDTNNTNNTNKPILAHKNQQSLRRQPTNKEKDDDKNLVEDEEEEDQEDDDEEDDEDQDDEDQEEDQSDEEEDESSDGFEDQGSSSDEGFSDEDDTNPNSDSDLEKEAQERIMKREDILRKMREDGSLQKAQELHVDDLSSDDEEVHNTIGNVPIRWYEDYNHIGYNLDGQKIIKSNQGDGIDDALAARDDPNFRRTIYDAYNDRKIVLGPQEMEMIRRIQAGSYAHSQFNAYPEYVDYYTSEKSIHALGNDVAPKSRFLPSKWEHMRVMKIVKGIREGRISLDKDSNKIKMPEFYELWKDDDEIGAPRKGPDAIQAPKMPLPTHAESYNPPEEYLFTEEEQRAWEEMDPSERELNFIPKKFNSLRQVCGYSEFVKERFERCLDLYLCPRANKRKLNIDPESLVPQLPKPKDLRPFPNTLALSYLGHTGRVRCLSMGPRGQYFVSGSDDMTVSLWEVDTGRRIHTWQVGSVVHRIEWNPNPDHHLIAVAAGKRVIIIATGTGSADATDITNALLGESSVESPKDIVEYEQIPDTTLTTTLENDKADDENMEEDEDENKEDEKNNNASKSKNRKMSSVHWKNFSGNGPSSTGVFILDRSGFGIRVILEHENEVKYLAWHRKGDYIATVAPSSGSNAVTIHQISKRQSQHPFSKTKGIVQAVAFHPSKPLFYVATQTHVRIYNLVTQSMIKKLQSGVKWISSLDVHPSGDHLIIGSYDRRICWFDLDLSSSPFKTMKYHTKAIRSVVYHSRYPLMASASDDGTIHIFHAMVYSDLLKNPLIVPLKILRGHDVTSGLGVLSLAFHPTQPWVISGGADGTIRLFQNIH